MNKIIGFLIIILFSACQNKIDKKKLNNENIIKTSTETSDSIKIKNTTKTNIPQKLKDSEINELIQLADTSDLNFYYSFLDLEKRKIEFFTGYTSYNEEENGYNNPAYIKVFIENYLVYNELFEAYEDIRILKMGTYNFMEKLDFYSIEYGLEAHDYLNFQRLFFIKNKSFNYIDEFTSQSTDYASRYTEFLFPTDSSGIKNQIIVLDKIDYHTEEEPNRRDTLYYKYDGTEFKKL
ncbi:protein of unknown function [Tenacibaculum soleae]|uniref:hypothetical protein n=1 Tax=Tenacibaculum soleae TaxID=447689 RepID=UPI003AB3892E